MTRISEELINSIRFISSDELYNIERAIGEELWRRVTDGEEDEKEYELKVTDELVYKPPTIHCC